MSVVNFIVKRLLFAIITLLFTVSFVFFTIRMIPGNPLASDYNLPEQIRVSMEVKYGLDQPITTQYMLFLENLLKGDLGISIKNNGRSVNSIISEHAVVSGFIGLFSLLLGCGLALILGLYSAINEGGIFDKINRFLCTCYFSIPIFVISVISQYFLCVKLGLFPVICGSEKSRFVLPILLLSLTPFSNLFPIVRNGMLLEMRKDYFTNAQLLGMPRKKLYFKYALKNVAVSIFGLLFPLSVNILTGSFIIETVFGIPGISRYYILSVINRDYTTIVGLTVFFTALMIVANFISDVLCKIVDRRIKIL